MLEHDRVEILILSEFDLLRGLKATGFKNIPIIEPEISRVELFHMLNKEHEALVPNIAAVLKAMKADGSHKKITDDFLAGYAE